MKRTFFRVCLPLLALGAGALLLGCGGRTMICGDMEFGPGIVLVERGNLYAGTYERGGRVDADGHFEVELPDITGPFGVHVYHSPDYFYLPIEVNVRTGHRRCITQADVDMDRFGWYANWPNDPDILPWIPDDNAADNPAVSDPMVMISGDTISLSLEVNDPDGDLSQQVLAFSTSDGIGVQLNPPPPGPVGGNYPNGTYTGTVFTSDEFDPAAAWFFVAADHFCSNSTIEEL